MFEEKIVFKDFSKTDYYGYAGVIPLPDGSSPKIYTFDTRDSCVDMILSGSDNGGTLICMVTEDTEHVINLPGFNQTHYAVAEAIVREFENYEITSEAAENIAHDYGMVNVIGG